MKLGLWRLTSVGILLAGPFFAGAGAVHAQQAAPGSPLAAAEPGAGSGAPLITHDQAAADLPPAATGMAARTNGLNESLKADQAPGSDRLAMNNEPDKLVTTGGEVRLNLLLGHQLYSTSGQQLGLIEDVLISPHGESQVIVHAGGHLVAVPWSKLLFGTPGAVLHGRPVLPGGSRQDLGELPAYSLAGANG